MCKSIYYARMTERKMIISIKKIDIVKNYISIIYKHPRGAGRSS